METKRKIERSKRAKNRKLIAYVLAVLFLIVMIAGYLMTGTIVLAGGFILPVAVAYYIAGWWESRELKNKADYNEKS